MLRSEIMIPNYLLIYVLRAEEDNIHYRESRPYLRRNDTCDNTKANENFLCRIDESAWLVVINTIRLQMPQMPSGCRLFHYDPVGVVTRWTRWQTPASLSRRANWDSSRRKLVHWMENEDGATTLMPILNNSMGTGSALSCGHALPCLNSPQQQGRNVLISRIAG